MRWLESILLGATSLGPVTIAGAACKPMDLYAAEVVVDYLDSWRNIHLAYQQFRRCDEAAVSEGFSRGVTELLAASWKDLPQLVALANSDPDFETFVWTHLDDTTDDGDRRAIAESATRACPKGASATCARIAARLHSLGPWRDQHSQPET